MRSARSPGIGGRLQALMLPVPEAAAGEEARPTRTLRVAFRRDAEEDDVPGATAISCVGQLGVVGDGGSDR